MHDLATTFVMLPVMFYYHWSDALFQPNTLLPIGSFGKWIMCQGPLTQEFERIMEARRHRCAPHAPSRLNCLFMLQAREAEGFPQRQHLYELIPQPSGTISRHNYKIGSYFSDLVKDGNHTQMLQETALMDSYWLNSGTYITQAGVILEDVAEFITDQPALINDRR